MAHLPADASDRSNESPILAARGIWHPANKCKHGCRDSDARPGTLRVTRKGVLGVGVKKRVKFVTNRDVGAFTGVVLV